MRRALRLGFAGRRTPAQRNSGGSTRGQFSENETSGKTDKVGSTEYQTPTLEAVCDRRIYDNALGMVVDSDDDTIPASVITGWFTAVYEAASAKAEK